MPATYEPIATTTLSSAASTITFSSIPSTYTDLRLIFIGTGGADNVTMTFNSSSSGYSQTNITGNGTAASSNRLTSQTFIYVTNGNLQSTPTMGKVDIFSYAGSTYKTTLNTFDGDLNGSGQVRYMVGLWQNTSAINRIDLTCSSNFNSGFTATLYGIKAA